MADEREGAIVPEASAPGEEELLSLDEAAQFLGSSKPTLYRLLGQGDLKGLKVGRQWRFRKAELVAYMERGPAAIAAVPTHDLEIELAFFAEELRRAGAILPEGVGGEGATRESRIFRLADAILRHAILLGASDIHLEPVRQGEDTRLLLRIRIDGVLHEVRRMPVSLAGALGRALKVMADMDASERRLPQDGRIPVRLSGKDFDVRVASIPSLWGEAITLRILYRSGVLLGLDKLGLAPEDLAQIREWSRRPHGLAVATGPAGSGKTTLLYSCLQEVAGTDRKTITLEKPVEMSFAHMTQIPVDKQGELDYAAALRAVLRQDPDILFVAELPDEDTLRLAFEAALTGHLVFGTLPVPGAAEAVRWLSDRGGDPLLVTSTLAGVVAQRLARRVCPACKEPREIDASDPFVTRLRQRAAAGGYVVPENATFYHGRGCGECRNRGYKGRIGLFEVMSFTPEIGSALLERASPEDLEMIAVEQGMRTLLADGIRKAVEGHTTWEEVWRVVSL